MSPDPCHGTSSTSGSYSPPHTTAGRNRVSPVFVLRGLDSRAFAVGNLTGLPPLKASRTGLTKRSKVTIVETGLPGKPKNGVGTAFLPDEASPKTTGFPG